MDKIYELLKLYEEALNEQKAKQELLTLINKMEEEEID